MAVYFVLGSILVAWGLGLAIYGLLRADFPPDGRAGRTLIVITVGIVAATLVALIVTTKHEHPRAEAAAKAAEQKGATGASGASGASGAQGTPAKPTAPPPAGGGGGQTVKATEKEFSIALASGKSLKAGKYTFDVQNAGQIQHDLTIDGDGVKGTKTPLINGGSSAKLSVSLKPATYTFYCSVPGHEQAGMKLQVTVR